MPLRAFISNPIVLAVVAVAAIGLISYQILKGKRKVPVRGRIGYRDDSPSGFDLHIVDDSGNTKVNEPKSSNVSNDSRVRKRNVATKTKGLNVNCDESNSCNDSLSNSIGEKSDVSSDSESDSESRYAVQQNNEAQKVDNNVSQVKSKDNVRENINEEPDLNNLGVNSKNTLLANVDVDEDLDLSESNNSLQNYSEFMDLDESNHSVASCSTRSDNIRTPSPCSTEEIYKRDVSNYLKTDMEDVISLTNFSDEESDVEDNFSVTSKDSNTHSFTKKSDICKGCLEEFANAVAFPCKHRYLCLDCAVKVHRIYKKCSICSSVIETFGQFEM